MTLLSSAAFVAVTQWESLSFMDTSVSQVWHQQVSLSAANTPPPPADCGEQRAQEYHQFHSPPLFTSPLPFDLAPRLCAPNKYHQALARVKVSLTLLNRWKAAVEKAGWEGDLSKETFRVIWKAVRASLAVLCDTLFQVSPRLSESLQRGWSAKLRKVERTRLKWTGIILSHL